MRVLALTLYVPLVFVSGLAYPQAADVRTGAAAFGDWQTDAPGVRRHIQAFGPSGAKDRHRP